MKSVQQLRDTAQKERTKADALRKEAEGHRTKVANLKMDTDSQIITNETGIAQKLVEDASRHDTTALDLEKEAENLEQQALKLEREQQDVQTAAQAKINSLESQKKSLRGE